MVASFTIDLLICLTRYGCSPYTGFVFLLLIASLTSTTSSSLSVDCFTYDLLSAALFILVLLSLSLFCTSRLLDGSVISCGSLMFIPRLYSRWWEACCVMWSRPIVASKPIQFHFPVSLLTGGCFDYLLDCPREPFDFSVCAWPIWCDLPMLETTIFRKVGKVTTVESRSVVLSKYIGCAILRKHFVQSRDDNAGLS